MNFPEHCLHQVRALGRAQSRAPKDALRGGRRLKGFIDLLPRTQSLRGPLLQADWSSVTGCLRCEIRYWCGS